MPNMRQIILQEENEKRYSRSFIDGYIREAIAENTLAQSQIAQGVDLIELYKAKDYYPSKNKRIAQLSELNTLELVTKLFTGIAYFVREELFTSVTAQLAGRLGFDDKTDAIKTVAEILAVLCETDAFDICKASKSASLVLISRITLSNKLLSFIDNSQYLPPMVCIPLELTNNYSSGYLLHKDSLILGKGNHHDGDICLDVLNTLNRVELVLDKEFLSTFEEDPNTEFTLDWAHKKAAEKGQVIDDGQAQIRVNAAIQQWKAFKKQSYSFYSLIAKQDAFYLTHKVDKRGRIYAFGYHISTMGTSFKKASIELAKKEVVTGVI